MRNDYKALYGRIKFLICNDQTDFYVFLSFTVKHLLFTSCVAFINWWKQALPLFLDYNVWLCQQVIKTEK